MWHRIEFVAESHYLDLDTAQMVAENHSNEFSVVDGRISTFYADAFIAKVKEYQGDQTGIIRMREIEKQRAALEAIEQAWMEAHEQ